jgi:hypothetical protein
MTNAVSSPPSGRAALTQSEARLVMASAQVRVVVQAPRVPMVGSRRQRYTHDLRYTPALPAKHVCFNDVNASHSPAHGASLMYSRCVKKPVIVPGKV